MKIRNGFVSNSSSSSFIIAAKDSKSLKCKIEIMTDLNKYIDDHEISTELELTEKYISDWGYSVKDLKDIKEYRAALKEIKKGNKIFFGSFSNESGDSMENYLCDNGLNGIDMKDVTIIQSEGGF